MHLTNGEVAKLYNAKENGLTNGIHIITWKKQTVAHDFIEEVKKFGIRLERRCKGSRCS